MITIDDLAGVWPFSDRWRVAFTQFSEAGLIEAAQAFRLRYGTNHLAEKIRGFLRETVGEKAIQPGLAKVIPEPHSQKQYDRSS